MDLVAMEACVMTMIEVAHQIRDHARVLVGSEELEPGGGWPYPTILGDLAAKPTLGPKALGGTIVRRYIESYEGAGLDATQSAIDLDQLDDLVEGVDLLGRRLLAGIRRAALRAANEYARRQTLSFFEDLYVDLHRLTGNLAQAVGSGRVADACRDIQRLVDGHEAPNPIIAERDTGQRMAPTRGLSICFSPSTQPSGHYQDLDFACHTRWAEFLGAYPREGRRA